MELNKKRRIFISLLAIISLLMFLASHTVNNPDQKILNRNIEFKSKINLEEMKLKNFNTTTADKLYAAKIKNEKLRLKIYSLAEDCFYWMKLRIWCMK